MDKRLGRDLRARFRQRFIEKFPDFSPCRDGALPKAFFSGCDAYSRQFPSRHGFVVLVPDHKDTTYYFIQIIWNRHGEDVIWGRPIDRVKIENLVIQNNLVIPKDVDSGDIHLTRLAGMTNKNWYTIDISQDDFHDKSKRIAAIDRSIEESMEAIQQLAIPFLAGN